MEFKFTRHAAGTLPSNRTASEYREMQPSAAGPLVSCLMVTRGNVALVASAFACFRAQTWHNKELVVVCDNVTAELRALLESDARVRLIEVTQKLALGDLRNLSVASSMGTYVCQWDDDDLYDPRRIAVQMGLIMSANVMAVFLSRWLIWWPARDVLALSGRRQWEGSMLAHRSVISVYPSMSRGEDSQIARLIADYHPTVLVDCPQMYCYRVTGENTFDASHFEQMLAHAPRSSAIKRSARCCRCPASTKAGVLQREPSSGVRGLDRPAMTPRIIRQTCRTAQVPDRDLGWQMRWQRLNPGDESRLWTSRDIEGLVGRESSPWSPRSLMVI